MSEDTIESVEPVENPEPNAKVDPEEAKARQNGWVDREEWESQGKDVNKHVPAFFFNQKGQMIGDINRLTTRLSKTERNFEEQLEQNNTYWKTTLETQLNALTKSKADAVEDGDLNEVNRISDEEYKLKQQIDNIKPKSAAPEVNQDDLAHEAAWFNNNPWYNNNDPRGVYARAVTQQFIAQGLSGDKLTSAIDNEIAIHYPQKKESAVNENREQPAVTDKPAPKSGAKQETFSYDSLTANEKNVYRSLKNSGKFDDKQLQQMIKNSRK